MATTGLKLTKYPNIKLGIVQDTSKTLTIQMYPKLELVIITADVVAAAGGFLPRLNLLGAG